jgi:hypothetical protein
MITVQCGICEQFIAVSCTNEQYARWKNHEGLIQDIMPDVPRELRELLISGTCPACFDEMFGEDDD